jgi:signal transduction histidine kinase
MNNGSKAAPGLSGLPLQRKIPLIVLALFAFVLGTGIVLSYYEVRHAAELAAADRLKSLSQAIASVAGTPLTQRVTNMRRVAADTTVVDALRNAGQPSEASVRKAMAPLLNGASDSGAIGLWTRSGRPIGPLSLEVPERQQRIDREMTQEIERLEHGDSVAVGSFRSSNGRTNYWIAVPVIDPDKKVLGYLGQERIVVNNPAGTKTINDLMGSETDGFLRNARDSLWVRFDGTVIRPASNTRPYLGLIEIADRAEKGVVLSSTSRIPSTPFAVTVERPLSSVLARPLAAIRRLSILAILLVIFGAVAAWFFVHRLVAPLGEVTRAAEAISAGDYSHRVTPHGGDEVGRLAVAFNHMVDRVETASAESSHAVASLTKSVDTQQFLADASRAVAGAISDEHLLADLVRLCVPRLADYATIHLVEEDGDIRRIETLHYDPAQQSAVRELVKHYPYHVDDKSEVAQVIRSQKSILIEQIDIERVRSAADGETRRLLARIQPTSFMCVPLIARGRAFGAMSFTMTDSGRRFSGEELEIALEVARRTAVAIDNALIYRRSLALRLEAEAASTAKSDFLAKMSHEIRTPINAMMGYAELLQMGIAGPITSAQKGQLDRIRASGTHLTELVGEILDLAKIEAGRMSVEEKVASVGEVADAALALIRPQAATKGVDVGSAANGNGSAPTFIGDPQRVQQILTNLLSNAVKFTPNGGQVSVHCNLRPGLEFPNGQSEHDWACVTVKDTGVGISRDDFDRIFQPFVQVDDGYTRNHGGTGLGLTISRSLAQMMGGDITVESDVGAGSRFTLWLPSPDSCNA